jgi:hypothetical protein
VLDNTKIVLAADGSVQVSVSPNFTPPLTGTWRMFITAEGQTIDTQTELHDRHQQFLGEWLPGLRCLRGRLEGVVHDGDQRDHGRHVDGTSDPTTTQNLSATLMWKRTS